MENIGPYRIVGEIGRGGMGIVLRAFDPGIGRSVAIKVLKLPDAGSQEQMAEARLRFMREAAAIGRLSHPNIVTLYQLAEESGHPYLVMEFVDGSSLDKLMLEGHPISRELALRVIRSVAEALDYAHSQGVVHRDVKPGNILVCTDGRVKVTDFGIARILSAQGPAMTQAGLAVGTPAYMAPEQIQASHIDGRADQFSLAVITYQLLTGQQPFTGQTDISMMYKIVNTEPSPLHDLNTELPNSLDFVLLRALSKKAENRYDTCAEFATRCENALSAAVVVPMPQVPAPPQEAQYSAVPIAPPPVAAVPSGSGKKSGMLWVAIAAVFVLICAGLGALVVLRHGSLEQFLKPKTTAQQNPAPVQPPAVSTESPATTTPPSTNPPAVADAGPTDGPFKAKTSPPPVSSTAPDVPVTPKPQGYSTVYFADWKEPNGKIYRVQGDQATEVYQRRQGRIYSLAVSPAGAVYFCADKQIYQLQGGVEQLVFSNDTYVRNIAFDATGHLNYSESNGDKDDGKIFRLVGTHPVLILTVHRSDVDGFWSGNFAFDHKGTLWLSGGNRTHAGLYQVDGQSIKLESTMRGAMVGIAFRKDGSLLFTDMHGGIYQLQPPSTVPGLAYQGKADSWMNGVTLGPATLNVGNE
jgi:serine/threonine protein kinase